MEPDAGGSRPGKRRRWSLGRRVRWLIRREWRRDRLQLGGLDRASFVAAAGVLLAFAATAAVALVFGVAGAEPGGRVGIPGNFVGNPTPLTVPLVPIFAALLTQAVLSAAFAVWSARKGGWIGRAGLLAIAVVSLALWGRILSLEGTVRILGDAGFQGPRDVLPVLRALGWLGIAAALLLPALPSLPSRWSGVRGLAGSLAAVPATLAVVLALATEGSVDAIPGGFAELASYPDRLAIGPAVVAAVVAPDLLYLAPLLLVPFVLWQTAVWARFGRRDLALRLGRRTATSAWLLPALLGGKLTWLALGYAGLLPRPLGGASPVWAMSRADGAIGVAIAAAFVVVAGLWLRTRSAVHVSERGFVPAALGVVLGMSAPTLLAASLLVVAGAALLLPVRELFDAFAKAANAAGDLMKWAPLVAIAGAILAGAALVQRTRLRSIGLFLLVFGAWGLPRAIDIGPQLVAGAAPGPRPLSVELTTVDALLTIVLAVLAVGWWAGRQRGASPESITLALVVSTLLVHTGTLAPPGSAALGLYLGLLVPPLYSLAFDSRELNRPSADRGNRLLFVLATAVALLAIVVDGLAIGAGSTQIEAFAQILFALPFGAMLVAATISARRRAVRPKPPGIAWRDAVTGAAAGIAFMVALAAAVVIVPISSLGLWAGDGSGPSPAPSASPAPTPAPTPTPTPAPTPDRIALLAAFATGADARTRGDEALLQRLSVAVEQVEGGQRDAIDGVAMEMETTGRADLDWAAAQPIDACFAGARDVWNAWRTKLIDSATAARAWRDGLVSQEAFLTTLLGFVGGQQAFIDALNAARPACGLSPEPSA